MGKLDEVPAKMQRRCRLPPDLVMCEVLLRLPVKTLIKFQCVSRSWRTLISDPYFRESHRNRSKQQNPRLLVCTYDNKPSPGLVRFSSYDTDGNSVDIFDKEFRFGSVHVLCTCLDLVCLRDYVNVYLCNPATQELITLPSSVTLPNVTSFLDHEIYGFGYASSTNEFKVLRIFYSNRCMPAGCVCEVFSLGTDCWRAVGVPPCKVWTSYGVFVNGAIYMLGDNITIAYFDIDQEKWGMLPDPTFRYAYDMDGTFVYRAMELSGYLCVTFILSDRRMDFWLLKKYDDKWVKEFTVDLSPLSKYQLVKLVTPLTTKEAEEDNGSQVVDANQLVEYVIPMKITTDDNSSRLVQPRLFPDGGMWYPSIPFSSSFYYSSLLPLKSMSAACPEKDVQ